MLASARHATNGAAKLPRIITPVPSAPIGFPQQKALFSPNPHQGRSDTIRAVFPVMFMTSRARCARLYECIHRTPNAS
jgi:hypothetical protein